MTLYLESVNDYVAKNIKIGDTVQDRVQNVVLGKVTNITVGPDISYFINDKGLVVQGSRAGYNCVTITFEGQGIYGSTSATFSNIEYYINKSGTEWRIGNTFSYAKISDIKEIKG